MSLVNGTLRELCAQVCAGNRSLAEHKLVTLTWGNVSGFDRKRGLVAIKPSGVDYLELTPEQMVIVDLEGNVVEGDLRPSSDTPTHVHLYRAFAEHEGVNGITHTHSPIATAFSQARRPIPCLGTTHADHFIGQIPVTRPLTEQEVNEDYEGHTGTVIAEVFTDRSPKETPGVLVAGHAPFCWGKDARASVRNAIVLEAVAEMALATLTIDPDAPQLEAHILHKHYSRKHGPDAYYGQPASR